MTTSDGSAKAAASLVPQFESIAGSETTARMLRALEASLTAGIAPGSAGGYRQLSAGLRGMAAELSREAALLVSEADAAMRSDGVQGEHPLHVLQRLLEGGEDRADLTNDASAEE